MKAIILVAGKGERLLPLTKYLPKPCLPVAGIPLLHIWMRKLKDAGVTDLFLNPSYGGGYIKQYILSAGIVFKSITLRPEREPMGTAQTLLNGGDWIGDDDFLVVYGDVLTDVDVRKLHKVHQRHKAVVTTFCYPTDTPSQKGIIDYGKSGWATSFVEKPAEPLGCMAFSGIFWAKSEFLGYISKDDVEIGSSVMPKICSETRQCFVDDEFSLCYTKDIGTIYNYLSCQTEWKSLVDAQNN